MTVDDQISRTPVNSRSGWRILIALAVLLLLTPLDAIGQTSSASRPLSATVIGTHVAHNGELTLLVLWRGSPGWYARGGGNSSSGGGSTSAGREVGSFSLSYGGRTFSIDVDYTARMAKLLDQEISLADTNVVLVDEVDSPAGPRIVGRHRVDPALPAPAASGARTLEDDPAILAIRQASELGGFLQCDIPVPLPTGIDPASLDPAVLARVTEYVQGMMTQVCRAAVRP